MFAGRLPKNSFFARTFESKVNRIILINRHDGASSSQTLASAFRFVCCNRLVVGEVSNDIREAPSVSATTSR